MVTYIVAILKFKHKGLKEIFNAGKTAKITKSHHARISMILDFLNAVGDISDCAGQFEFHRLSGDRAKEYAMSASGNYRITFKWNGKDVYNLNYEDYH